MILELMRCEYVDRCENVLLIGGSGTGKTHLATVLAAEACARGKRVRFYRVTELITQLLEAREERQLTRLKGAAGEAGPAGAWTSSGTCRRARWGRSCCST